MFVLYAFLFSFSFSQVVEETSEVIKETGSAIHDSTLKVRNTHTKFEVQKLSGEVKCVKFGHNMLGSKKVNAPLEECIDENNTNYFLDEDGSCNLITTNTAYPLFLKDVPKEDCPPDATFHPASNLENNLYQDLIQATLQTCELIGNCYKTLKSEDHKFMAAMTDALNRLTVDESLAEIRKQGPQKSNDETRKSLEEELYKLKRILQICGRRSYSSDQDTLKASFALKKELEPLMKELEHEIDVFHWFRASYLTKGIDNKYEKESVSARFIGRALQNNFFSWDFRHGTGFQGRGLYASRTILSTRSYGSNLLKITIPEGSKYLDLEGESRTGQHFEIKKETLDALSRAGCELDHRYDEKREIYEVKKYNFSSDSTCRGIFNNVIKDLDAKFLTYGYKQHRTSACRGDRDVAFVLIDVPMNEETVDSFSIVDGQVDETHGLDQFKQYPSELHDYLILENGKTFDQLPRSERERLINEYHQRIYDCEKRELN